MSDADPGLVHLVTSIADVGITLAVGGLIVTGRLISRLKFEELLINQMRSAPTGDREYLMEQADQRDQKRIVQKVLDELETGFPPPPLDGETFEPNYIHLEEVKLVSSERIIPLTVWRGRLSSVDGWSLEAPQIP